MKKFSFFALFAFVFTFCFLVGCTKEVNYTVSFNSALGTAVESQTVKANETAVKPADPTKEGHAFVSWTLDGADYDFSTPVTSDITLTAKWDPLCLVKFVDADGNTISEQYVAKGDNAVAPTENPTKPGEEFLGWNEDFTNVQGDLVVTPKFEEKLYTITFKINGEVYTSNDQYMYGDTISYPTEKFIDGFQFKGWDSDAVEVEGDLVINAIYERLTYNVEFYVGDTKIDSFGLEYNIEEGATLPTLPGNGYTFEGWYEEDAEEATTTLVGAYGNKVLYAKVDGEQLDIIMDLVQNNILPKEDYKLTFQIGDTVIEDLATTYNIVDGCTLPTITGQGYSFGGWYDNADLKGEAVTTLVGQYGEKVLYASVTAEVTVDSSVTYVKDTISVSDTTCTLTMGQYKTIANALTALGSHVIINLPAGTTSSVVKINRSGVTLKGANANINPNTGIRGEETIITSTVTLAKNINNVIFDGIKFTGNARITCETYSSDENTINNENIQLLNCYVDITTTTSTANGFFDFPTEGRTYSKNIVVDSCYFTGTTRTAMIYLDNNYHVSITNTVAENITFKKASNDGYAAFLYIDDSAAGCSGDVIFTNNKISNITNTNAKLANAIYIHWIGDYTRETIDNYAQDIVINENEFTNITGYVYRNSESNGQHLCYDRMEMNYNTINNVSKILCIYMGVNVDAQRFPLESLEELYGPYNNTFAFNYNKIILGDNYQLTAEYATGEQSQALATPVDNHAVIDASKNIYLEADGATVVTPTAEEFGEGVEVPTSFGTLDEFNAAVEASK